MSENSGLQLLSKFMLALCVWREARGESHLGKRLVASVIRNRVEAKDRWPSTYVDVITQKKQFSSFNAGDPNSLLFPRESDPSWLDALLAAEDVLSHDVFTTANHYHTTAITPKWADAKAIVAREGHHVFYHL